jgi:hypothetical protein
MSPQFIAIKLRALAHRFDRPKKVDKKAFLLAQKYWRAK